MSLQPPDNLDLSTQSSTDDIALPSPIQRPMATDTKDATTQSNGNWHNLCPEIISLIFEFYVYPPGWEEKWDAKFLELPSHGSLRKESWECCPGGYFNPFVELGMICRQWQNIVLSTPTLWNKLFIIINHPGDRTQKASSAVNHARKRLERSKKAPLMLYMACYPELPEFRQADNLLPAIIGECSRWSDLLLRGSCRDLSQICDQTLVKNLPACLLRALTVVPNCSCFEFEESNCFHTTLSSKIIAPPTSELFLTQMTRSPDPKKIIMNINWTNVTYLVLNIPSLRAGDCMCILEQAHQLRCLCVCVLEHTFVQGPVSGHTWQASDVKPPASLHHNALQIFKMHGHVEHDDFDFLYKVEFPALTELHVLPYDVGPDEQLPSRLNTLEYFISQSQCSSLKRLDLIVYSFDAKLIGMLKEIPTLEYLHIAVQLQAKGSLLKMRSLLKSKLLGSIINKSLLPSLRQLSLLINRDRSEGIFRWNSAVIAGKFPVNFILVQIRRSLNESQATSKHPESAPLNESRKVKNNAVTSSFSLLTDKDLMGVCYQGVHNVHKETLDLATSPNLGEFFMRSIELHQKYS